MLKTRLKNVTLYAALKAAGHVILFTFQAYQRQKWFTAKVLSLSSFLVLTCDQAFFFSPFPLCKPHITGYR